MTAIPLFWEFEEKNLGFEIEEGEESVVVSLGRNGSLPFAIATLLGVATEFDHTKMKQLNRQKKMLVEQKKTTTKSLPYSMGFADSGRIRIGMDDSSDTYLTFGSEQGSKQDLGVVLTGTVKP